MKYKNFNNRYKKIKVLVTGSTGFKGSWLCLWLNLLGAKVIGVALKPEKESIIFKALKIDTIVKQYYCDIKNFKELNYIIKKEKPKIIFHLAAQSIVSLSYKFPLKTFESNVLGSVNLLESCRKNLIKNLVMITSDKCYLNQEKISGYKESDLLGGNDNYSSSKAAAEIIFNSYYKSFFRNKFVSFATARAGNVIGGGDFKKDRIVPDVIKAIKKNRTIIIRNPEATRPWQHVLEPISGYLKLGELLMRKKIKKKIVPSWNFGPTKKSSKNVLTITKKILSQMQKKNIKIKIKKSKKFKETKLLSLNINKSKKELNWTPNLNLDQTINFTVKWYKAYYEKKDMKKFSINQIITYLQI